MPGGVCNFLEGRLLYALIEMYKNHMHYLQELVFYNNTSIILYVLRWQVGGYSPLCLIVTFLQYVATILLTKLASSSQIHARTLFLYNNHWWISLLHG